MKHFLTITGLLLLTACTTQAPSLDIYLTHKGLEKPSKTTFQHCQGYGCKIIKPVALSKAEWKKIDKFFSPAPKTAAAERHILSAVIGHFETLVGAKTGTSQDKAGTFGTLGDAQLDCVDESTNTSIYLTLLAQRGLLRFHTIEAPTMRLPIIHAGRWPHQTAVIHETLTGERFAVDSWFHDNGAPADIIPLNLWKDGWKPKNTGESRL